MLLLALQNRVCFNGMDQVHELECKSPDNMETTNTQQDGGEVKDKLDTHKSLCDFWETNTIFFE